MQEWVIFNPSGECSPKSNETVRNETAQSALNTVRAGDKMGNSKPSGSGDGSCQAPKNKYKINTGPRNSASEAVRQTLSVGAGGGRGRG